MGSFVSKEDILVEIAILFKQMENGKLTLEELEQLVNLSGSLHERAVILRYKAFEEKVFGVRPVVAEEIPVIETITETIIETIIEVQIEEEVIENKIIEQEVHEEEAPLFKMDVKDEPSFGFSLFGNDLEEAIIEAPRAVTPQAVTPQVVIPQVEVPPIAVFNEQKIQEEKSFVEQPMSEVERAHAENLARFLAKSKEVQEASFQASIPVIESVIPVAPSPSAPSFEKVESFFSPKIETIKELPIEEEVVPVFVQEVVIEKVIETIPVVEVSNDPVKVVGQQSSYSYGDLAQYIHKYNLVDSGLASQFGVTKINSLIGSFGLNERLQFINELYDGSSDQFSEAIKILDIQASSENARTKVAEFACSNNWDVESETVVEFMQKVIRRYA